MPNYRSTGRNPGLCGPPGRVFPVDSANTDLIRVIQQTDAAELAIGDVQVFSGHANGWDGDTRIDLGDVAPARSAPWPGIQPP